MTVLEDEGVGTAAKISAVGYSVVLFYICPWSLIFELICDQ